MKKNNYAERFIVSDAGDYSVGIDSWSTGIDVIMTDFPFTGDEDKKDFTEAMKQFLMEYFDYYMCKTECVTLSESEQHYAELKEQTKLEEGE